MAQAEFEFLDGSTIKVDLEKAEEFILKNLGKFKKKHFKPRGHRRASTC